ncbi:hypothetical protein HDF24_25505 [Mucilaginibacter sp. X4EP1]|uniref:hypothetical protein n=1 Tax=Mucilaginibacter sp. X4EP1 TaxID=2723092 RepID=UPI00216A8A5A|nr:hypothetical protein [Mucilaginibacter sp. X4EP1]MCS3816562.1 hypothetical protein [Mucilaginibacter sp. X4EP1]
MLKNIPIKKEYLLVAGTIIAVLICYQLAFKKTIMAWQLNKQLNTQLTQASDLNVQPAYLERKSANLSKITALYKTDTTAFRSNVISNIAGIAEKENVKLSEVPLQDPSFHTDKFIIQKLDFEGDFFSLTKVLKQLQSTPQIGMLRSVSYKSIGIRSNSDESKKLVLEVYLELVK